MSFYPDDLPDVVPELVRCRFLEANSLCRYHVNQRTTLHFGENRTIQVFRKSFTAHDHSASRSAKRLVGCARHEFGVRHRRWVLPSGNQADRGGREVW